MQYSYCPHFSHLFESVTDSLTYNYIVVLGRYLLTKYIQ